MRRIRNNILNSIHEQFAENQNHHQALFIQLLIALLVLFGGFGYTYVHTTDSIPYAHTYIQGMYVSNSILITVTLVVLLVLLLLNLIILHLGYAFRRDQTLNMRIRKKELGEEYDDVFGYLYNPSGKGFWSYLPNFYAIFFWIISILQLIVFIGICVKKGLICFSKSPCSLVEFLACFFIIVISYFFYYNTYEKYKRLLSK
ncbi:hypothetical protein [uncultured Bacteroides sp.]|uniref:hypothetical protein n=1 Tax=uncultured Bacteroides sp. TaxID=162156 RepID=UPI002AABD2C6|nr:hypothetical protein [uncultured Bacteroides sp.]